MNGGALFALLHGSELWAHQRRVLLEELSDSAATSSTTVNDVLQDLVSMEEAVVSGVESSKARDDHRGCSIIPDYLDTHTVANQDPIVIRARTHLAECRDKVAMLLKTRTPDLSDQKVCDLA